MLTRLSSVTHPPGVDEGGSLGLVKMSRCFFRVSADTVFAFQRHVIGRGVSLSTKSSIARGRKEHAKRVAEASAVGSTRSTEYFRLSRRISALSMSLMNRTGTLGGQLM